MLGDGRRRRRRSRTEMVVLSVTNGFGLGTGLDWLGKGCLSLDGILGFGLVSVVYGPLGGIRDNLVQRGLDGKCDFSPGFHAGRKFR